MMLKWDEQALTIAELNIALMLENQKLERLIKSWWPNGIRPAGDAERLFGEKK